MDNLSRLFIAKLRAHGHRPYVHNGGFGIEPSIYEPTTAAEPHHDGSSHAYPLGFDDRAFSELLRDPSRRGRTDRRGSRGRGLQLSCRGDGHMNVPFSTKGKPETQIVVFTPAMRTLIADAIESLIFLLDEIDGDVEHKEDADFENEPDIEPSLGATNGLDQEQAWHRRRPRT